MATKVDTREARVVHREPLLCASDRYFFGCMGAYAMAAMVAACTGAVSMDGVSFVWMGVFAAPFVFRPLGRSLGLRE